MIKKPLVFHNEPYSAYLLRMANNPNVPAATHTQALILAIEAQRREQTERLRTLRLVSP